MSSVRVGHFKLMDFISVNAKVCNKFVHLSAKIFKRFFPIFRIYKVFYLHLLELAQAKKEIAGGNLVSKRLAYLRHAKRKLGMKRINNIFEIHKHSSCRLWSQIRNSTFVFRSSDVRLEHHVELFLLPELALAFGARSDLFGIFKVRSLGRRQMVRAESFFALSAFH